MLDIKFVRENPDAVKENIKKKFQDAKLPLVDEVIEKDAKYRAALKEVEALKAARNKLSKANGPLFGQLKKCTDEAQKAELQAQIDANNAAVKADADKMAELEKEEEELSARIQEIMYYYNNVQDDVNAVVVRALEKASAKPWDEAAPILHAAMDNIMEGELEPDDDDDEEGEFDMSQMMQGMQQMMQQGMQQAAQAVQQGGGMMEYVQKVQELQQQLAAGQVSMEDYMLKVQQLAATYMGNGQQQ